MKRYPTLLAALIFSVVISPLARAQFTWSPTAATSTFETPANWTGGVAPSGGTSLTFGPSTQTSVVFGASTSASYISFSGTYPAYTLSSSNGSTLSLSNGINVDAESGSATSVTFASSLSLALTSNQFWSVYLGRTLAIYGNISGAYGITKNYDGTLILGGANTFSGGLTFQVGTLLLASSSTYSSPNVTSGPVGTGTLTFTNYNPASDPILGVTTTNTTLHNNISITRANLFVDTGASPNTLTLAGLISGAGSRLTKIGTGTLTLSGANIFTGGTIVSAGTLLLGSSSFAAYVSEPWDITYGPFGVGSLTLAAGTTVAPVAGAGAVTPITIYNPILLSGDASIGIAGSVDQLRIDTKPGLTSGVRGTASGRTLTVKGGVLTLAADPTAGSLDSANLGTIAIDGGAAVIFAFQSALPTTAVTVAAGGYVGVANGVLNGEPVGLLSTASALLDKITDKSAFAGTFGFDSENPLAPGTYTGILDFSLFTNANFAGLSTLSSGIIGTGATLYAPSSGANAGKLAFSAFNGGTLIVDTALTTDRNFTSVVIGRDDGRADAGSVVLTNPTNTYTGGTTLKSGTLVVRDSGALGTGMITATNASTAPTSFATAPKLTTTLAGNSALNVTIANNLAVNTGYASAAYGLGIGGIDDFTLAGTITGNGVIDKYGAGTLTLSGDGSAFSGKINILAGTLRIGGGSSTGSITGNIANAGTLAFYRSDAYTFAGIISGTGSVTQQGFSSLTLTALNTYTGGTQLNSGSLRIGTSSAFDGTNITNGPLGRGELRFGSGSVSLVNTGATTILHNAIALGSENSVSIDSGTGSLSLAGVISGLGGRFTKTGNGTLTLTGVNTYTGGTSINEGTLLIGADTALGSSGSLSFAGGTLKFSADVTSTRTISLYGNVAIVTPDPDAGTQAAMISGSGGNNKHGDGTYSALSDSGPALDSVMGAGGTINTGTFEVTLSGIISGAGSLTKEGVGTLILTGANTYSGGTTINAGAIIVGADNALGSSGDLTFGGGTLKFSTGVVTIARAITLNAGGGTIDTNAYGAILSNVISGTGPLTHKGTGILTLSGANTYTGGTTVTGGGTLDFTADNNLGANTSVVTLNGGYLRTQAAIADFTHAIQIGASGGNINSNGFNSTLSGVITGTGLLAFQSQSGNGILTLTAANTYTGATYVDSGTLRIGAVNTLPTSTALILSGSATIDVVNSQTIGSLASSSSSPGTSVALTSGKTLTVSGPTTTTYDGTVSGAGTLAKSGTGGLTLTGANTYTGGTTVDAGTLTALNSTGSATGTGNVSVTSGATLAIGTDGTIGTVTGNIANAGSLTFNRSNAYTYAGVISGNGTITKNGTESLTFTGDNTFTGTTTINAGYLVIGNLTTTGSIAGNIVNNAVLTFARSNAYTYGGVISGTGTFFQSGTGGTLTLTGANTYTGITNITSGTLAVGAVNALPTATAVGLQAAGTLSVGFNQTVGSLFGLSGSSVILGSGATLTKSGSSGSTFDGVISGPGALAVSGFGQLTLTTSNTYTGGTTIGTGSTLNVGNGATTGSITGNVANNGILAFNRSDALTYAGVISGTGSLSKLGTGTLTLTGASTYSGSTTVSAGTLSIGAINALPSTTSLTVTSGAILDVANNLTLSTLFGSGTTTVAAGKILSLTSIGSTLSSVVSGAGGLSLVNVNGPGLTITANQTYTGVTTVSNSFLSVGSGTVGSIAGNVTISGNLSVPSLQFNRSDSITYGGVVSGSGVLAQAGSGILTLTGQSTFFGDTYINAGTLRIGTTNALPVTTNVYFGHATTLDVANDQTIRGFKSPIIDTSTVIIASGKALTVALAPSSPDAVYGGNISGAGTLVVASSTSTLGLDGSATHTGGTTINSGGSLSVGVGRSGAGSISGNISNNGSLIFNRPDNLSYSGVASGTGTLTKLGAGNLTLIASNTYGGGTTVSAGTLQIGSGGTSGSVTGNITNNAGLAFNRSDSTSFTGVVSGTGSILKQGAGNLSLNAQNTYAGSTTVSGGTLTIGVTNALPVTTQLSLLSGAILDALNSQTIAGFMTDGAGSSLVLGLGTTFTVAMPIANTTTTFAGNVSGSGIFAVSGAGNDIVNLTGSVTNTGGTLVGTGATLIIASGGTITGPITTSGTLSFGTGGAQTFNNPIGGTGGISVSSGTTTLSGNNTYSGPTNITGGKLIVTGNNTGGGTVTVGSGAVFGGTGSISGPLVLGSGGGVAPGASPGTLSVGATTFAGGANFAFEINNTTGTAGTNWDLLSISGALTITATAINPFILNLSSLTAGNSAGLLANFNAANPYSWQFVTTTGGVTGFSTGAFQYNASQFQNSLGAGHFFVSNIGNDLFLNFTPVPEPSTYALLALGLGVIVVLARRRRS